MRRVTDVQAVDAENVVARHDARCGRGPVGRYSQHVHGVLAAQREAVARPALGDVDGAHVNRGPPACPAGRRLRRRSVLQKKKKEEEEEEDGEEVVVVVVETKKKTKKKRKEEKQGKEKGEGERHQEIKQKKPVLHDR